MAAIDMEYVKGEKKNIRIIKKIGGDDIRTHKSILLNSDIQSPPKKVEMAVVQFCLSAPKTNMDRKDSNWRPFTYGEGDTR